MARVTKPREGEPIRLLDTASAPRYRVVLDVAPKGGRRKQVTRTFDTLADARTFVDETRSQVRRGDYVGSSNVTVPQLVERWLSTTIETKVVAGELRRVTADGYDRWLNPARTFFADVLVTGVRHSDVEAFKAWCLQQGGRRGGPLSARATSATLGALQRVFKLAVLDGLIQSNPCSEVKLSAARKPAAHWTLDQLETFRKASDSDPLAVALRLVLCGLRRSEVLGLTWQHVDLSAGVVRVRQGRVAMDDGSTSIGAPKSKASVRDVWVDELQPGTSAMLTTLREAQATAASLGLPHVSRGGLVVLDAAGRPLRPELLSDRFGQVARQVGLPPIKMHAVRHSIATALAADPAVSDIDAAALLGHSLVVFQQTYAQPTDDGRRRAAQAMGASLRRSAAES